MPNGVIGEMEMAERDDRDFIIFVGGFSIGVGFLAILLLLVELWGG